MKFEQIPGMISLKETLVSSHTRNHLAHAQLFSGQEGGAALPMALAYATYLLCENKSETDACGTCPNCQKMAKHIHPDVHYFFPAAKPEKEDEKTQRSVNEVWRKLLIENPYAILSDLIEDLNAENKQNQISKADARKMIQAVSMKSFEGGLKILIIWYPEKMHPAAANGILKILEEPPKNTLYLMVSYQYEALLTTILSRTQLVLIPAFTDDEIVAYLMGNHGVSEQDAIKAGRFVNGNLHKALIDLQVPDENELNWFIDWMRYCLGEKFGQLATMSEQFKQISRSKQQNRIQWAIEMIRNAVLAKGNERLISIEGAERDFILKFSNALTLSGLESIYKELSDTMYHLERYANPQMAQLTLSIRLSNIIKNNRA
ncbi:MAG: DNA polymerase III subunit delta [Flammeovirgaceae bacterium]|jgi:DNA polymerase III subunit delta'|nr:DNA polymerase III subunit delta [Flammeovirgaceae bacterium]|tara:strand:+ start:64888 stop:66012 length:1125 start_codon:yes stop_codon:yes gene_type:complete